MIVKYKGKWQVRSSNGKKLLGTHDTHKAALRQLAAIEASKAAKGKKKS